MIAARPRSNPLQTKSREISNCPVSPPGSSGEDIGPGIRSARSRGFPLYSLIPLFAVLLTVVACVPPSDRPGDPLGNEKPSPVVSVAASGDTAGESMADYRWPRFLGETFNGEGDTGSLQFDFTTNPALVWQMSVGDGYGLGCVSDERYYQMDAVPSNGGTSERLRCLRLSDASEVWSVTRPMAYRDLYDYEAGPRGTPTISGDTLVTYGVDGVLIARSIQDGKELWKVDTNAVYGVVQNFFGVGSSPLVDSGLVYVSVGGSPLEDRSVAPGRLDRVTFNGTAVVAFDLATGEERWKSGDDLASYSSPRLMQLDGKKLVLMFGRENLLALDAQDGTVRWKYRHRADIVESVNAMMPVVNEDLIFISECYQVGSVLLRASLDGVSEVWKDPKNRRKQSMGCHWSTPALIDGALYGCSGRNNSDSSFRCVDFETGELLWSDDRRIRSSVVRAGDHLIVLEEGGTLQIIQPNRKRLEVVAEYDFRDLLTRPCWAAPILVGNRLIVRGDRQVVCMKLAIR